MYGEWLRSGCYSRETCKVKWSEVERGKRKQELDGIYVRTSHAYSVLVLFTPFQPWTSAFSPTFDGTLPSAATKLFFAGKGMDAMGLSES